MKIDDLPVPAAAASETEILTPDDSPSDRDIPDGLSIPGVRIRGMRLDLPDNLKFEDWESVGRTLQRVEQAIQWLIGDWINFGEHHYGESYAQAMEATGREYQTVANARYVASRFDSSRRREDLPFAHHAEVAALAAPDADRLLEEASTKGWNRQELRTEVQRFRQEQKLAEKRAALPAPPQPTTCDIARGDCANLHDLGDGGVDLIVTSPPYDLEVEYAATADDLGYAQYLAEVERWARELLRVGSAQARACINVPLDTNKGGKRSVYADYVRIFTAVGWTYQTSIVWQEDNISKRTAWGSWQSPSAPFITAPVEMIAVFHKGEYGREATNRIGYIARDEFIAWTLGVWQFPGELPARVGHPTPFPEELPRRLILLYSFEGDVVLDPFLGSGTTGVVSLSLNRTFIGRDVAEEYVALARERIARAVASEAAA